MRLTPGKQVPDAQKSSETGVPYVCPVTGLSCLRYPFTALPDCGHAFSSRAIAQVRLHCACLTALPGVYIYMGFSRLPVCACRILCNQRKAICIGCSVTMSASHVS